MIVLRRRTNSGSVVRLALPVKNLLEASAHKDDTKNMWVRYWNGTEVRSIVVEGNVDELLEQIKESKSIWVLLKNYLINK